MLEAVNPVDLLPEYVTEEGAPTDDEMNRLATRRRRAFTSAIRRSTSTIQDRVSQTLKQ